MWAVITSLFGKAVGWVSGNATKLWLYAGAALALTAAIGAAWLKARSDGANAERVRQMRQVQKNIQERANVENSVRRADDPAVDERLRKWQRD